MQFLWCSVNRVDNYSSGDDHVSAVVEFTVISIGYLLEPTRIHIVVVSIWDWDISGYMYIGVMPSHIVDSIVLVNDVAFSEFLALFSSVNGSHAAPSDASSHTHTPSEDGYHSPWYHLVSEGLGLFFTEFVKVKLHFNFVVWLVLVTVSFSSLVVVSSLLLVGDGIVPIVVAVWVIDVWVWMVLHRTHWAVNWEREGPCWIVEGGVTKRPDRVSMSWIVREAWMGSPVWNASVKVSGISIVIVMISPVACIIIVPPCLISIEWAILIEARWDSIVISECLVIVLVVIVATIEIIIITWWTRSSLILIVSFNELISSVIKEMSSIDQWHKHNGNSRDQNLEDLLFV